MGLQFKDIFTGVAVRPRKEEGNHLIDDAPIAVTDRHQGGLTRPEIALTQHPSPGR